MNAILVKREDNNLLYFYGYSISAADPYGYYKFLAPYRVLSFLQNVISNRLRDVAGNVFTREFVEKEIEKPICKILEEQRGARTIMYYDLFVDNATERLFRGVCAISFDVMPVGGRDIFRVKMDVPEFKPLEQI